MKQPMDVVARLRQCSVIGRQLNLFCPASVGIAGNAVDAVCWPWKRMIVKDDTIALGNAILPILGDGVGLYSWDLIANNFCGDAETAHLFALDPMQLAAGVTVEMIIGCVHADDREYLAKSLHMAIIDGTLCRGVYHVPVGDGHYRQVLVVLRCFGYSDGLPTTCAGFVCEMPSETTNLTPRPQSQSNVVQLRKLR